MRRYQLILALLMILLLTSACINETEGPIVTQTLKETQTPVKTAQTQKTTPPEETKEPIEKQAQTLTSGNMALYFTQSLRSVSEGLKGQYKNPITGEGGGYQIDWSKTGYGVFRYVPEIEELTLVKTTISPSYAKHTIKPITQDGRLLLATEYSTQIGLDERNPKDNIAIGSSSVHASDITTYAILEDKVYYRTERDCFGTSCRGGALSVYDTNTRQSTVLLKYGHQDNFGRLYSAGGKLYTTYYTRSTEPYEKEGWIIQRRDPNTFKTLETIADYTDYTNYGIRDFAFDQNAIYIEAYDNNGVFELWKQELDGSNPKILYTNTEDGETSGTSKTADRIITIDSDDGYILLNFFKGPTIVYDEHTNTAQKYELGLGTRRDVQILKIR